MKHIIDTDKLEKLPKYAWSDVGAVPCNRGDYIHIDDFRKLIANSPQADGMANSRDMFEQFATLHNMPVLKVGEAYSNDDTNYAWWIWQKARATLQTKPVAVGEVVNEEGYSGVFVDFYDEKPLPNKTKLFTHPPASVPLEKYNKLLDVLQELDRALCVIGVVGKIDGYDVIRRDSVIDIARDRLKKAEANLQN